MSRRLISTGSPFEQEIGYSRAVLQETPFGKFAWVAGTTGYDYTAMRMPDDPAEQARNALKSIRAALAEAGLSLKDVVRVRYYLTHKDLAEEVIPVLGEVFSDIRPAATMVIADLIKPEMLIEIEADAFRPSHLIWTAQPYPLIKWALSTRIGGMAALVSISIGRSVCRNAPTVISTVMFGAALINHVGPGRLILN